MCKLNLIARDQPPATAGGSDIMPVRTPKDLAQLLKLGKIEPVYFLYGSEVYLRDQAIRLITDTALTGTLLPGITRDSLLKLAADLGYGVEERRVSVEEWRQGCADGSLSVRLDIGAVGARVVARGDRARKKHRGKDWRRAHHSVS